MYAIQGILNHRFNKKSKKLQYLIKWEGFNMKHNTWQPESHLQESWKLLELYKKTYNVQQQQKVKETQQTQKRTNSRSLSEENRCKKSSKKPKKQKGIKKIQKNKLITVSDLQKLQTSNNSTKNLFSAFDFDISKEKSNAQTQFRVKLEESSDQINGFYATSNIFNLSSINTNKIPQMVQFPQSNIDSEQLFQADKKKQQQFIVKQSKQIQCSFDLKILSAQKVPISKTDSTKTLIFQIQQNNETKWVSRQFFSGKYIYSLCDFYEKNLVFLSSPSNDCPQTLQEIK